MRDHLSGLAGAPVALGGQGVQLACTHLDDGELAGDKKAVERDQESDGQQFEKDHAGHIPDHCRAADVDRVNSIDGNAGGVRGAKIDLHGMTLPRTRAG
jgi:hypothetical protein